ncbi:MAG: Gfo/Idh/MocA family protein [Actinomycetota bacterium]
MTVRWGIAGTGRIASDFVRDLANIEDAEPVAVGSRTAAGAAGFAETRGIARAHGSMEELAADPGVDIVYVAGIHPVHRDHAVMMMRAGKHVLVEKPLAMNADEVQEIIAVSTETGRFMMEAMWMRFNPLHTELRRRLDAGEFGRVVSIESDFSFQAPRDPSHRLFDPGKGGGALLDVGIYPLNLAWWWLGAPAKWSATGDIGPTGVDEAVTMELEWHGGASAVLTCGSTRDGSRTSTIVCENATIVIAPPSHSSPVAEIRSAGSTENVSAARPGLHHQVREVQRCTADGLRESPRMPHAESLAIARFMDDVTRTLHGR